MTKKLLSLISGLLIIFLSISSLYAKDIEMDARYFDGATYLYDNFKSFEKDAVVNVEVGMKHAFLSGVSGFENGREDIQYINIYSKRQNINSISITDTNKSKRDIWQSFIYNGYNKDKKVHVYLLRFQLPINQNSVSIISNSYIVIDIKSHTYYAHLQVFNSPNFLIKRVTEKNEQVLIKRIRKHTKFSE